MTKISDDFIEVDIPENDEGAERTGTITINSECGSFTVNVSQFFGEAPNPALTKIYEAEDGDLAGGVSPKSGSQHSNGRRVTFADNGSVTWNNVDGGDEGGNHILEYHYYLGAGTRVGEIEVNGVVQTIDAPNSGGWSTRASKTVAINLSPGTGNTVIIRGTGDSFGNLDFIAITPAPLPSCEFDVADAPVSFLAEGGTVSVTASSEQTFNYSSSDPDWLEAFTDEGGGGINISAQLYEGTVDRSGTITVSNACGSQVINVTQSAAAATPCTLNIVGNTTINATTAGLTRDYTITSDETWNYTKDPADTWVIVTRSGDNLSVQVAENTSTSARTATIDINGCENETISISQEAAAVVEPCTLNVVGNTTINATAAGLTRNYTITSDEIWNYTKDPADTWVIVTRSGDNLSVQVAENTSTSARTATIDINGCENETISISQGLLQ